MRIKVFKAANIKDAIVQAKKELGVDAVILHTKKYRKGGFLGYKSKEIVEVTAAVEDTPVVHSETKPARNRFKSVPAASELMVPRTVLTKYKAIGLEANRAQKSTPAETLVPSVKQEFVPSSANIIKSGVVRADVDVTGSSSSVIAAKNDEQACRIHQLEAELVQMKELVQKVMQPDEKEPEHISLQAALKTQGINEQVLQDMVRYMSAVDILSGKESERAKKSLAAYLGKIIRIFGGIVLKETEPRIVALIGATGVGKTTTLAKIAARFVLEQGVSVALITADTYRISAVEQLKTYSDIIGLPLDIVYSPAELRTAIQKHRNKQLVLIDTAGRSQYNEYQMQELKDLLDVEPAIEKHLVLSATTKEEDAKEILEKFSVCQPDRVLFTKTDETKSLGFIVNLLYRQKIGLSYLTNGQSVPDDIVPARSEQLAEMLLR